MWLKQSDWQWIQSQKNSHCSNGEMEENLDVSTLFLIKCAVNRKKKLKDFCLFTLKTYLANWILSQEHKMFYLAQVFVSWNFRTKIAQPVSVWQFCRVRMLKTFTSTSRDRQDFKSLKFLCTYMFSHKAALFSWNTCLNPGSSAEIQLFLFFCSLDCEIKVLKTRRKKRKSSNRTNF